MSDDEGLFSFHAPDPNTPDQRPTSGSTWTSARRPITSLAQDIYQRNLNSGTEVTPAKAYALAATYGESRHQDVPLATLESPHPASLNNAGPRYDERNGRYIREEDSLTDNHSEAFMMPQVNMLSSPDDKGVVEEEPLPAPTGFDDPFQLGDGWDFEEDSPYPEVRASVSNIDDPSMPSLTIRVWIIGLALALVVSAANTFLYFRYPSPIVSAILVQLVSYPLGKFMANVLPIGSVDVPSWLLWLFPSGEISLNPGPFNIKEHAVITIMCGATVNPAYGLNAITAAQKFYGFEVAVGLKICLLLSQQLLGFGVAGMVRRFLVWPAGMIWPQNLVFCTLLNTLHAEEDEETAGTNRLRFFGFVFCGACAYYFLPGFLFTALSYFSFICWIKPDNVVVNQLFGVYSGLGMSLLTLDWSQITYIGSPLIIPWFVIVNVFVGFVLVFWIIAPPLYYTNTLFTAYLPMSTSQVFDRFGAPYNTTSILNSQGLLDVAAYEAYSPLILPVTYFMSYGLDMAVSTACLVHTVLMHGKDMFDSIRGFGKIRPDVHMKLMARYQEVPFWWYLAAFVIFGAIAIATCAVYAVETPVWALIIAIILALVYVVPAGILYAIGNQQLAVNVIIQIISGYILPGRPIGNMIFKSYTISTLAQSLQFAQDLKLGHYIKIPPRVTFSVQFVVTVMATFLQVGVTQGLLKGVPDLCTEQQKSGLSCPYSRVYYSSSIVWGLLGPGRLFNNGQLYHPLLWCLLVGAVLPVPFWFLSRRYPHRWFRLVNIPLLLNGPTIVPPATGINFSSWFMIGMVFQYFIRKRHYVWWSRFVYLISAALDSGTVLSTIIIFLALQLPKGGTIAVNWWGNEVYQKTLDWAGVSFKQPPADGFGPTSW